MHFENSDCDEKNANTSASEFQFVTMIRDFNSSKSLKILKKINDSFLRSVGLFRFISAIIRGISSIIISDK